MEHKTFYHQIPTKENIKITISTKSINGQEYYYANFINVDLDYYKKLDEAGKKACIGMEIKDDNQAIVYYQNPNVFENDIKENFGINRLKSKM